MPAPPGLPGPAPGPAGPPAPPASVAFMPALTASTNTPLTSAGEYDDTRFARGGYGVGGTGRRRLPCILVLSADAGVVVLAFALADLKVGVGVIFAWGGVVLKGGLGMLSGLSR